MEVRSMDNVREVRIMVWRRIFCIRRPIWAWLLYVLWVETFVIMQLNSWTQETLFRIDATNLLRPAPVPGSDWWVATITAFMLWLGIGFALVHVRWYGVLAGLCIVFLTLMVLRETGIYV